MTIDRDEQGDALVIPTAKGNEALQVVRWTGQREFKTTSGTSQLIVLPVGSKVIEITAVADVFINFGDGTPIASSTIVDDGSRLLLAGVQVVPVPINPATGVEYLKVAVIQSTAAGIFQVEQVS